MGDEREIEKKRESCVKNMIMPYHDIHNRGDSGGVVGVPQQAVCSGNSSYV